MILSSKVVSFCLRTWELFIIATFYKRIDFKVIRRCRALSDLKFLRHILHSRRDCSATDRLRGIQIEQLTPSCPDICFVRARTHTGADCIANLAQRVEDYCERRPPRAGRRVAALV